ncbi:hypothetical protein SCLCIDRAFT_1220938 [Scleroderma citrinum Foug A]|uniref:Uncharacterized protein n=1 Tax=Scleroderma citrinum Foug A TaxID=1036808 RepID=A0A0C2Z1R2_9AGAM|nr:hypothetical protein SCLCIDRAFT_1220938 [Scleroderma citrinum Foug A]
MTSEGYHDNAGDKLKRRCPIQSQMNEKFPSGEGDRRPILHVIVISVDGRDM